LRAEIERELEMVVRERVARYGVEAVTSGSEDQGTER